jgi:hypothetical protein
MCFDAKSSSTGFWIISFMALMIWYRNQGYDRALSIFILLLGMIQLVEFTIHNGSSGSESGKWIFMILWLQILALTIGTFVYINPNDTILWSLALIMMLFGIAVFLMGVWFTATSTFDSFVGKSGHIEWYRDQKPLMGGWFGPLYLLGLFAPLILLWLNTSMKDMALLVIILYGVASAVWVASTFPSEAFSSMWCYLAVGFAFLWWFVGIFKC